MKGDPAIRGTLFQQCRVESPLDRNLDQGLSILEELLGERGIFQCQIHFSSSQATIWTLDDPYRYRILDQEALADPDICLLYPPRRYPADALIPRGDLPRLLGRGESHLLLRRVALHAPHPVPRGGHRLLVWGCGLMRGPRPT